MNCSIVIPNYNGGELLKKNLPKVLAAYNSAEVIVVDDGSTDNSCEVLRDFTVKVLVNPKNMGFASTVNRGIKEAKGDIIILLNTDVIPEKEFIKTLLTHFQDKSVFGVGCMDKSIEGNHVVLRGRGIGKWMRGFLVHRRGEVDKKDTLWVSGGSCALRKSLLKKLGYFDELYNPFYWEDIDICYRALKTGFKLIFEPRSVVLHEHAKGTIKSRYSMFQVKTIAYRNQFIFVWKNVTDLNLQVLHLLWLPYHFIKALLRLDGPFFLGFFAAFIRLPKVIQSRSKEQRLFVRNDKEIIHNYSCL
jgi:GT2 family glycosyltransferase